MQPFAHIDGATATCDAEQICLQPDSRIETITDSDFGPGFVLVTTLKVFGGTRRFYLQRFAVEGLIDAEF